MPNGGSQHYALATLLPGNKPVYELTEGWTYFESFWGGKKNLLTLPRFEHRFIQPAA
jgi:hypothetical protein